MLVSSLFWVLNWYCSAELWTYMVWLNFHIIYYFLEHDLNKFLRIHGIILKSSLVGKHIDGFLK